MVLKFHVVSFVLLVRVVSWGVAGCIRDSWGLTVWGFFWDDEVCPVTHIIITVALFVL